MRFCKFKPIFGKICSTQVKLGVHMTLLTLWNWKRLFSRCNLPSNFLQSKCQNCFDLRAFLGVELVLEDFISLLEFDKFVNSVTPIWAQFQAPPIYLPCRAGMSLLGVSVFSWKVDRSTYMFFNLSCYFKKQIMIFLNVHIS